MSLFQGDVFLGRKGSSSLFPRLSGLGKAQMLGAGDGCPQRLGESVVPAPY